MEYLENLMKSLRLVLILLAVMIAMTCRVYGGGNMAPPNAAFSNGVPVSTMKTMNDVEPRIPITALPFTITNAGSYYLVSNLYGKSTSNGIEIDSSDVQLDLAGFALVGRPGSQSGIAVLSSTRSNITIKNGVVKSWGGSGIDATQADHSSFVGLKAFTNGVYGIAVGENSVVSECAAHANGDSGIYLEDGSSVAGSSTGGNAGNGIYCLEAVSVRNCVIIGNTKDGINGFKHNLVKECTVIRNGYDGIEVYGGSRVIDNNSSENGTDADITGCGILVQGGGSRIQDNNITANEIGIRTMASGNVVVRNSAYNNNGGASNYVLDSQTVVGTLIQERATISVGRPWANFDL